MLGGCTTNYNQMRIECERLEERIHSIQEQIKQLPPGKLICTQNGQYIKWYHSDGRHQHYIPKKQRAYAQKLAFKKYLMALLSDLMQEKRAIQMYLKTCPASSKAEELLNASSEYQSLLIPYFSVKSKENCEKMKKNGDDII